MRHQAQLSQQVAADTTARLRTLLVGVPCWYVSAGSGTWPAVHLAMGERIPRARRLANTFHPEAFRMNDASRSLMAWSDWVLKHGAVEVVTSAHPLASSERVNGLVDQSVSDVGIDRDRTLRVSFTGGWELVVRVASQVPTDDDTSWTLHVADARAGEHESETVLQLADTGLTEATSG